MSLGSRIREFRKKRGLTQSQLADKLHMTEANISSYERDKSVPPGEKLNQLAEILGVSTDYLLGRTDDTYKPLSNKFEESKIPEWATAKDKRDFKKMLEEDGEAMFYGDIPLDDEDREKIKRVIEALFWDAKKRNKRKKPKDE